MKRIQRVFVLLLASLWCIAMAGCAEQSLTPKEYRISDERVTEGITLIGSTYGMSEEWNSTNKFVGKVIGREAQIIPSLLDEENAKTAYVACFVEVEKVMVGTAKPGDIIAVTFAADYIESTKTFQPSEKAVERGGFFQEGDRVEVVGADCSFPEDSIWKYSFMPVIKIKSKPDYR